MEYEWKVNAWVFNEEGEEWEQDEENLGGWPGDV
jgi:hypothetical protein